MSGNVRLELRFKNALLFDLTRKAGGCSTVAIEAGVALGALYGLINLQVFPWRSSGRLRVSAQKLCEYFRLPWDELFPNELYSGKFPKLMARNVNSQEFLSLGSAEVRQVAVTSVDELATERSQAINQALATLTPREADTLRMRFGIGGYAPMTLAEVGGEFGLTQSRIRQIQEKALLKLRHPSRSRLLSPFES